MFKVRPRLSYRFTALSHMQAHLMLTNRETMMNLELGVLSGVLPVFMTHLKTQ